MFRSILPTVTLVASGLFVTSAQAQAPWEGDTKLLIVDRDRGRVVYDDGSSDLFCATRKVVVGYDYYGRPLFRRKMRCR